MGNEVSSQLQTEGKVNGRPVTFTIKQSEDGNELTWQEHKHDSSHSIAKKDMIAVLPIHAQVPDDYTILYVATNPAAKDDPKASPVIFQHIIATTLPPSFIAAYQPPGNACWQLRQDAGSLPNLHVIVSLGSGTGQAESVWNSLFKPMLQHVCPKADKYTVHFTDSESSVTALTKNVLLPAANEGKAQAVILLSGDGGLVDIIDGLLSAKRLSQYRKLNVALLPLGTGNALAHSTGITTDNTLGLRNLLQGIPRDLPLFRVTFSPGARLLVNGAREERQLGTVDGQPTSYGAVVCSWGFHAALVADSDSAEYRRHGAERFKMAANEALYPADGKGPHAYRGQVSMMQAASAGGSGGVKKKGWQTLDRQEHAYVLATPVSQLEQGFTISPASRPMDGKLRLVHFGALGGDECMEIMKQAYDGGRHTTHPGVGYEEIEALRIQFQESEARWRRVCVDGRIVRVEEGGWVEVRGGVGGVVDLILAAPEL
ncbi:hypothetical protein LTR62_004023 [Meristemomyces frigidus]|uniref:DAGKc domain-containing protein n=1 Tax=Meristemomyces frigidus TaxID=1508187 RepID=A0AAN7THX0_9PEZI|nr:hypothetical protein LTR62_004023 [Meristemomyces frigidus]